MITVLIASCTEQTIKDYVFFRPYFTYWVTFVQIMVYIIAVAVYGIAPIGFEETAVSSEVNFYLFIKPSKVINKEPLI